MIESLALITAGICLVVVLGRRTDYTGRYRGRLVVAGVYLSLVVVACVVTLADSVYDRGDGLQFMWLALLGLPWVVLAVGLGALSAFAPEAVHHTALWVLLPAPCVINFLWLVRPALREMKTSNRTTTPLAE